MPYAAPHPCGSSQLLKTHLIQACREHQREEWREQARNRPSPAAMGYGHERRKASREFLHEKPLCAECPKRGRRRGAAITDHVVPHKGDMALFWDRDNWQPLCWRCHSRKTANEDGRWK